MNHPSAVPFSSDVARAGRNVVVGALTLTMVAGVGALLLELLDLHVPGRALLAVVSVLLLPGVPLALALPIRDLHVQLVLGVALSLSLLLLAATVQLVVGGWSGSVTQAVFVVVGAVATAKAARPVAR